MKKKFNNKEINSYLKSFNYSKRLNKKVLTNQIDTVWNYYNLSNDNLENLSYFYSHPVWILNGLWTFKNYNSRIHRLHVVNCVKKIFNNEKVRVADYGGGAGSLGKLFCSHYKKLSAFHIIEPYPFNFFLKKLAKIKKLKFKKKVKKNYYDVIVIQTVFEHVLNPLHELKKIIGNLKNGKIVIIGNDFYPIEKCHLKRNFYLRHTFNWIVSSMGLEYLSAIKGCEYMCVYKVNKKNIRKNLILKIFFSKIFGPILNQYYEFKLLFKQNIYQFYKKICIQ